MKQVQYIDSSLFAPKDEWSKLSLQDRTSIIETAARNGMSSLSDIRQAYNSFAEGGQTNKKRFSSLGDITKDWESDYPIKDVTDIMKQGPYYLYESQFDGIPVEADGRYYVVPNYYNLDDVDENSYRVLDYKNEFRPLLPKRDYIGGDNYRERIVDLIPGLADSIYSKAKAYGADPNVMMRRIMKEGFLDNRAREYNELVNTPDQKDYWNHDNIWNREYNSAGEFGLDWVSKNIQDGLYELRNPEDTWMSAEGVNEKNQTVYPMVANLNTSLEALASDAAWRQGRIEKTKNPPKNELPFYVNASYNIDTEHKDLDNRPYILKTYSFDPYYDAQGKFIHKKDFGGPIVQAANKFWRGGSKMAKKVSDFSNGLLSPEDVDIILEHPSDFSEYLGWNQEKIDSLKNNFYKNTAPYGYDVLNGIAALQNTGINPQPIGTSAKEDMARDYLFAEYLGIPEENRKYPSTGIFTQSEYSPSMGSNTDTKYVRFSDEEDRNKIVSIYNDLVSRIVLPRSSKKVRPGKPYFSGVGNRLYRVSPGKSGKNYVVNELDTYNFNEDPYAASLGQYTIGRGFDNKGQYISVYDEWDLNPMHVLGSTAYPLPKKLVKKFSSLGDASGKFGKPVKYYDRIYLDDYYDIPEQYRGNYYLPEVTIKP